MPTKVGHARAYRFRLLLWLSPSFCRRPGGFFSSKRIAMRDKYSRALQEIMGGATTTATGVAFPMLEAPGSFQAVVIGTGAVSATVLIEVSNVTVAAVQYWMTLGTITLSGTTSATDGFAYATRWDVCRARVTAISGTGAAVTVDMAA
jgi:hypothetical protein